MSLQHYKTSLIIKKQLTDDVFEFHFAKPTGFEFQAGQFVEFIMQNNEETVLRSYSIASSPDDEELVFLIKIIPEGKASAWLDKIKVKDDITIAGPVSRFICKNPTQFYGIATGTGLAPVISMIRYQLETLKSKEPICLLWGLRYETDIFWQEKLIALKKKYPNFGFKITVSRDEVRPPLLKGRVSNHLPDSADKFEFYICGIGQMVKEVRQILIEHGINERQVHFEAF